MISLRLAVLAVLIAAVVAACITLVLPRPPLPAEADQRLPPSVPNVPGRPDAMTSTNTQRSKTENHIEAFERAAQAILKNAKASAGEPLVTGPVVTGPIPLPRRRPILAP
jgi:hypothetical protein